MVHGDALPILRTGGVPPMGQGEVYEPAGAPDMRLYFPYPLASFAHRAKVMVVSELLFYDQL
eukprot:1191005-Prorocentrum_minimum.AAC.2